MRIGSLVRLSPVAFHRKSGRRPSPGGESMYVRTGDGLGSDLGTALPGIRLADFRPFGVPMVVLGGYVEPYARVLSSVLVWVHLLLPDGSTGWMDEEFLQEVVE